MSGDEISEQVSTPILYKRPSNESLSLSSPTTTTNSTSPFSDPSRHQYVNEYAFPFQIKRFASTPVLSYSAALSSRSVIPVSNASVEIPIVGYEVMEERARFTVYKLRVENKIYGESWFVFRRYTDFVRLHSKLKSEFPKNNLILPRKRWFGDNFNTSFIEDRIRGLQAFIDSITRDKTLLSSASIREFFCLDDPPTYTDSGEDSRAIFEALEETVYHLRLQVREKDSELEALKIAVNLSQEKAVTLSQRIVEITTTCGKCKDKVEPITTDLQKVLCSEISGIS